MRAAVFSSLRAVVGLRGAASAAARAAQRPPAAVAFAAPRLGGLPPAAAASRAAAATKVVVGGYASRRCLRVVAAAGQGFGKKPGEAEAALAAVAATDKLIDKLVSMPIVSGPRRHTWIDVISASAVPPCRRIMRRP